MTDEIVGDEPLDRLVSALRRPVPIVAGLAVRAHARARRRHTARIASSGAVVVLAGLAAAGMFRRTPGTSVTFAITAPAVRSVALVGDFTEWRTDRVALERSASGEWRATVKLRPGRYRFAYVVDRADWRADAHAASALDDFGRPTSVVTVAGN
jgi:Glycogen recognition site of AMP-activated protein kinase